MNRVGFAIFVGFLALVGGWLYVSRSEPVHRPAPRATNSAAADAGAPADAGAAGGPADDGDAGIDVWDADVPLPPAVDPDSDAGTSLIDGSPVPALAEDRPKSVVFGSVLVQFKGAQGAATGARSREEGLALAQELAALAKDDFEAAVKQGDPGSVADAGRMFRGILEPAPEYVLFSLEKGEVGGPVETPRGFWVPKRLE